MGRPLYSRAYALAPVVREAPEPAAMYETWKPWTFDPDSDEFFEGENAVYEAFIDELPQHSPARREEDSIMTDFRSADAAAVERTRLLDRAQASYIEPDHTVQPISNATVQSSPARPMDGDPAFEDVVLTSTSIPSISAHRAMFGATPPDGQPARWTDEALEAAAEETLQRVEQTLRWSRDTLRDARRPDMSLPHETLRAIEHRMREFDSQMDEDLPAPDAQVATDHSSSPSPEPDLAPRTPSPEPPHRIDLRARAWAAPSTPPQWVTASPRTPFGGITPSPAPTVTPRLYSWAVPEMAASPTGPLTNPDARMSLAHIAPRDITA